MDAVEPPAEKITPKVIKKCATPISEDHDDKFGVPSLEELGIFILYWALFICLVLLGARIHWSWCK